MEYRYIKYSVKNDIGWITLNRSERLNAFNTKLMSEFIDALNVVENDHNINIVAISGEGRIFSAGIDLAEMSQAKSPEESGYIFSLLAKLFKRIIYLDKPVILALNGDAYGGGAEMIWVADIVLAVSGSKLGWFEAKWGLLPPILSSIGGYIIGFARAANIAMTSGVITVEQAYEWGLITKIVKSIEDLGVEVENIASSIKNNSPQSVRSIKNVLRTAKMSALIELGVSELEKLARNSEAINAAKSFVNKKKPQYSWK